MQLHIETAWVVTLILASIRIAPAFIMAPVFGSLQLPLRIRVLFVFVLATTLVSAMDASSYFENFEVGSFFAAALSELSIGVLLAFGLFSGFAVFLFGGRLLDMQMGFGVASLVDPATRHQAPLIGTALNLLAVMVFFAVDGHHMILRGLAYSFEVFPPGIFPRALNPAAVVAIFGGMFSFGFALVAPIVFCLLLIDIGMAIMSRTMPQVNIFFLAIALKIFVGMILLAASIQYMAPLMHRVFHSIYGYWEGALG